MDREELPPPSRSCVECDAPVRQWVENLLGETVCLACYNSWFEEKAT